MSLPLRELQQLFWQSIASTPGTLAPPPALLDLIEPSATLDAAGRLGVYGDAYWWRLHEVLIEDFPRVAARLGHDRFAALAREYLGAHPSQHPSVRHVGRALPAFLAGRADVPPWLADLAALEWARIEVFDAPDATPLGLDALRAVPPEAWPELRFVTIPAVAMLRAGWPVHELWEGENAAAVEPAETVVRVWRGPDQCVYHAPVSPRAAAALERLVAGAPFAALCEAFADLPPGEAAAEVTGLLARWVDDGMIAG